MKPGRRAVTREPAGDLAGGRSPRRGHQDDTELLLAARVDVEAFGDFFDRHYPGVLAYFVARVGPGELAADLCAETLAAALDGLDSYDPARGVPSQWLYGIARNKLFRFWRDRRASRAALDRLGVSRVPVDEATHAAMERVDNSAALRGRLLRALDTLPDHQADAVRLRVFEDLDYATIAERLGCGSGAARVRVHRGLRRLRQLCESWEVA